LKLEISNGKLRIDLGDLEKALAIRGGFEIPLQNIVKAGTEAYRTGWEETRAPGTHLRGVTRLALTIRQEEKNFGMLQTKES